MRKLLRQAWKSEDTRKKMLITAGILAAARLIGQIPIPGISADMITAWLESTLGGSFNLLDIFSGGSLSSMTIAALGITPYITASIIIQLLIVAIPRLEEIKKDGKEGQTKIEYMTKGLGVILALIESLAMSYGFMKSGYLTSALPSIVAMLIVALVMCAGCAMLIGAGWLIDKKGIGNGISLVLLVNIVSRMPSDLASLYEMFVKSQPVAQAVLAAVIIIFIILAAVVFTVLLQEGQRKVPIQYSRRISQHTGGMLTDIPIKVNTAGVVPIIFASSLLSLPTMVLALMNKSAADVGQTILLALDSSNWFNPAAMQYTVGILLYIALVIFFSYFYTSITFNPIEVADNLKKSGAAVPGFRPGEPTRHYIEKILNRMTFIGAVGMLIICIIPMILSGTLGASVSFSGTSLVIITGVVLETLRTVEAQSISHSAKSFL